MAKRQTPYEFFLAQAGYSYDAKTETPMAGKRRCAKLLAYAMYGEFWSERFGVHLCDACFNRLWHVLQRLAGSPVSVRQPPA